jgi:hypothetical protein
MKNIISEGLKGGHAPGRKSAPKFYSFSGTKQKSATDAFKVLGALNTLDHMLSSISGYARKIVFDNVMPEWLKDVLSGDKEVGAFTVSTGDMKAVIIPMKKYAMIDEERASAIYDVNEKYKVDIGINEVRHFALSQHLIEALPEEKMDAIIGEIKKALLKSALVPEKAKKDIRSGKLELFEETTKYEYTEDILTHLTELSKGDPKKAKAILDAVKPVFAMRSFEMDDKEVEVAEALDLIKDNLETLPVKAVSKPKRNSHA